MKKRLIVSLLSLIVLFFGMNCPVFACNEQQSNAYITQILFGDNYVVKQSDAKMKILLDALYICSEQCDGFGQEKLDYLKISKVSSVPLLSKIDISSAALMECAHNTWEYEYAADKKVQTARRKVLQNSVNKTFDFGLFSNVFGSTSGKCNSFAALLYYSHILADYLADDPTETEGYAGGKYIEPFLGQAYIELNGNKPKFTRAEMTSIQTPLSYSALDHLGRAGTASGCVGLETMATVGPRPNLTIKPSGWNNFNKYPGIVNSDPPYLFNRCHLIGRQFGGKDEEVNLVTGTRYMNSDGMGKWEEEIARYIKTTGNHVFYKVTPVFRGENKLASGVQLEAYSIEDKGKGVCFNVYCYNVQPGIDINYFNGENEQADIISYESKALPFVVFSPNDMNPDLIYAMNKHLDIIFKDQLQSTDYKSLMSDINSIANNARSAAGSEKTEALSYAIIKKYEYEYFETLKRYIPQLLKNESFFTSAFS